MTDPGSAVSARRASRLSVVIPNFNQTQYLGEAIRSVLAQTRRPDETIVVDDGSTDDCRALVAGFGREVRYIRQENRGLAGARNTGIRAATGDLVGLLDADDQWLPAFVESMLSLVEANPDGEVFYAVARTIDAEGRELPQVLGGPPVAPEALYHRLLRANFLSASSIVLRREVALVAGLFDESLKSCEDWEFWLRLSPVARFIGTGEVLVRYRLHGASLSSKVTEMQRWALAAIERRFGPDDGRWDAWSSDKRRAYGGAYRYLALTCVRGQLDWRAAAGHLGRALEADPSLAQDLDLFYELALGNQPAGYRGSAVHLDLAGNVGEVTRLLEELPAGDRSSAVRSWRAELLGTACRAMGLVAYNTGRYAMSCRLFGRALWHDSRLRRRPAIVVQLLKAAIRALGVWRVPRNAGDPIGRG